MLPWLQYLVAPLVAGIVGAFLSTFFAAHFSFRRFRREQWWQAKRESYESVIRRLAEISFSLGIEIEKLESGLKIDPPPPRGTELSWSLQEVASAGAYIVSPKTVTAVRHVLGILNEQVSPDYYEQLEHEYGEVNQALETVRSEAHQDLGI